MSKEKFTPGEWQVGGGGVWVGDTQIAEVYAGFNSDYEDEEEANAHLIAAAPEMYRMLKQLHGVLKSVPILQGEIEEVLKRARGEE